MSLRSILHVFGGESHELNALSSALALARASQAHVRILHIAAPPILPDSLGIGSYAVAAYGGDATIVDVLEKDARQLSDQATGYVADYCRREDIPLLEEGAPNALGHAYATFRVVTGIHETCLAHEAYATDLVVSAYNNRPAGDLQTALTALFSADRPILLLPRVPGEPLGAGGFARNLVFAWDGSRAAAQALREAVPHMRHAEQVSLLRVGRDDHFADVVAESDACVYLRDHGISPQCVLADRKGRKIGDALLQEAAVLKADLLAMGAYGHGHFGEMLLGGATSHVLKHGRLPLLLAR